MKTKVEIEGYEIEIEFEGGIISVKAEKDDEVVEEFSIEVEEGQSQGQSQGQDEDEDEIQGFGEFGQDEEEDFNDDEFEGGEEGLEDEMEGEESPAALESFQSFINKRK
jgi:hypothetical protein